ncbi:hypothetical protein [Rhizobacter fulvus]
MQIDPFVLAALDRVLSWDLSDDVCPQALTSEAAHLAGLDLDQAGSLD